MNFDPTMFGSGLGFGLLVALSVWIGKWRAQATLKRELDDLKKHLQTQLSINAKGYDELQQELKRLKQENDNLRATSAPCPTSRAGPNFAPCKSGTKPCAI